MSIYKYKEIELHGCFYYYGNVWHLLAMFGNPLAYNGFAFNGLLCKILIKVIQMQESNRYWGINGNGTKPFSLLYSIRPEGRIICSTEQSKLCFEALEMNSVPQNNLPLQGLKTSSEVGVF